MMRSSTPLKNAISATAVLITQLGEAISREERNVVDSVGRGSSLTGTMVNLFARVEMAAPLIDTFILREVPGVLYALFDYGLTFMQILYTFIPHYSNSFKKIIKKRISQGDLYVYFRRFNSPCFRSKW